MNNYKYMDHNGLKVMRIASLITFIVIVIILATATMVDIYYLKVLKPVWTIFIALGMLVLYILIFTIFIPILRYKNFRYTFKDNEIYIRTGIIFIKTMIIPFYRIQNLDIVEGFVMRKYNLATLHLSTAGGDADIHLISKVEALELKQNIQSKKMDQPHFVTQQETIEKSDETYSK